jgi:hypothetical protein
MIELRQPMSGAEHYAKYLRSRKDEVEHLRNEEEEHGLTKVAKNAYHGKGHSRKVTVSVSNKNLGRELVVFQKG